MNNTGRLSVQLVDSKVEETPFYKEFKYQTVEQLNLGKITFQALTLITELDEGLVGNPSYIGLACFWGNHGYKHALRSATPRERRLVHNDWIKNGLGFSEDSDLHQEIVDKHCRRTLDRIHGTS